MGIELGHGRARPKLEAREECGKWQRAEVELFVIVCRRGRGGAGGGCRYYAHHVEEEKR